MLAISGGSAGSQLVEALETLRAASGSGSKPKPEAVIEAMSAVEKSTANKGVIYQALEHG